MNKDYPEVAGIPAAELKAMILGAWAANTAHIKAIEANNIRIAMAEHRLIGLALQEAERE